MTGSGEWSKGYGMGWGNGHMGERIEGNAAVVGYLGEGNLDCQLLARAEAQSSLIRGMTSNAPMPIRMNALAIRHDGHPGIAIRPLFDPGTAQSLRA